MLSGRFVEWSFKEVGECCGLWGFVAQAYFCFLSLLPDSDQDVTCQHPVPNIMLFLSVASFLLFVAVKRHHNQGNL